MTLRVKKHLDVSYIVRACALKIRKGEVVKILLRDQHGHALIIDIEKVLKVAEPVRLAQGVDRFIR